MSGVELLGNRANGKDILVENGKSELEEFKGGDFIEFDSGLDRKGSSELNFLKRVLCKEIDTNFSDNKLVFSAVHAVFLESGFVGFDPKSGPRVDFFDTPKEESSESFNSTVNYTLPQLLTSDNNGIESIVLEFQTLGDYVNVNGSLSTMSSSPEKMHKLSIEKNAFVPAFSDSTKADAEEVIFEFWRIVKDGLALHLMIDLCGKTSLNLPPCLMGLPAHLKFKILERLSGKETARAACVCKEMHDLSANDELWKEKYMAEYGNRKQLGVEHAEDVDALNAICRLMAKERKWKEKYMTRYGNRKGNKEEHANDWKARFACSCVFARKRKKLWSMIKDRGRPRFWI